MIGIIVQARMNSTRLPGKIMKKVLDKPLLEYYLERLKRVRHIDKIIVATPDSISEEPIWKLCKEIDIDTFQGSELDVLNRFHGAAKKYQLKTIIRIPSDCTLIDPEVVSQILEYYLENNQRYDYVTNTLERTYPRGMDTEIFPYKLLEEANALSKTESEREHVTPYIYLRPEQFSLGSIKYSSNQSHHRWVVDTAEDFKLIKTILEHIYPIDPQFTIEDVLNFLSMNPTYYSINKHIEQKK